MPAEADFERLRQLERRQLLSVHRELLIALYASVATLVAGVGLLVRDNLDRIGPATLVAALLLAAGLCYASAIRTWRRGAPRSLAGDYLLLLGALLLSSAVGYAESQFRWFGAHWSWHLLWLAAIHAFTAHALGSRLVLSVALTTFAAWAGIVARPGDLWAPQVALAGLGWRALACATVFATARALHLRRRGGRELADVYEHFAANLALWGALALLFDAPTRWFGAASLAALATYVGLRGFRRGRETAVLYAVGYATFGLCWLEATLLPGARLQQPVVLLTLVGAVTLLWRLRARMKAEPA